MRTLGPSGKYHNYIYCLRILLPGKQYVKLDSHIALFNNFIPIHFFHKSLQEGLGDGGWAAGGGGVWNSLISKNLSLYSLSLKCLLTL